MTTTPGILWAEHNLPTPTHRWWSPAKRSKGAFNVRYEEFGEEEARDWVIRHNKGSGGSGVVSAVDLLQHGGDGSPIRVAMKTFTPLNDHARTILRSEMENEIRNVKRLRHIHIVEIIGSFEQSKEMGFFMRPCADDSLAYVLNNTDSMIQRRNKLGSRQKVSFFQFLVSTIGCLAHALKFIHGSELKHKDIKPANILVHGDQVFLTDFGLSKIVRENSTTSYGPTGATKPYAPREVLENENFSGRSYDQDIFSLGCCFIEIFATYKGKTPSHVLESFGESDGSSKHYAHHIPAVLAWMRKELLSERCDIQLWNLISMMVADDRKQRPSAAAVWEETILMRSSRNESVHFCGACCMPIMSDSIPVPTSRPLALNYVSRSGGPDSKNSSLARDDETFSTQYWRTEEVPYVWGRNLRITNQAALDAVQPRNDNSWFCRKIVFPKNEESLEQRKAWEAARAEAELLKWLNTPVKHHHLVQLAGTYKQGRTSVLLIRPLAHFDLKTYLSWIEEPQVAHDHQTDSQKLLRNSFGCLASAVKHVHSKGIIHDDIQPQNILITIRDSPSVCLAEFGAAATKASKPLATYQASNTSEYEYKQKSPYAPSSIQLIPEVLDKSGDIFSLGLIFLEIETVRKGSSRQQLRDFLADTAPGVTAVVKYSDENIKCRIGSWIDQLNQDLGTPAQLASLLKRMLGLSSEDQPTIEQVLQEVSECEEDGLYFCGESCMPD